MKRWKKTLALLLALAMTAGMMGCGQKAANESTKAPDAAPGTTAAGEPGTEAAAPKDPVLLEWYYRGNGQQQDTEEVEARVNELLKGYPGLEHVSININCFPAADYATQVGLAQTSGSQIDILNSVSLNFTQQVEDGNWMPMEDYISDELRAELPEWLWELGSVDGHIYMVPNYQNAFNAGFMFFPKEYMDKYGNYDEMYATLTNWDLSLADKAAALEDYVMAARAGEGDTKYANTLENGNATGILGFYFITPFDHLGNNFIIENGTDTVSYAYTTETYKEMWSIYADWYDKKIFAPDGAATDHLNYRNEKMMEETSYVYSCNESVGDPESVAKSYSERWGFEVVAIPTQQYNYIPNSWGAGGNGISSTCEHPEEAALFIEALTTGTDLGREIYNTMVFGIEGKHYTKDANDPDRIVTIEYDGTQGGVDTSYAGLKWILGNSFYAYKNQAVLDGYFENIKKYNESPDTVASSHNGFVVSTTNVSKQLEQINAVIAEYTSVLQNGTIGSAGFEAYYQEFIDKLNTAGLKEVIADYQAQLDAWVAANR